MARIKFLIRLDRIDRREPQALEIGHELQHAADEIAELRLAGKIIAPGGDVDARQHDLAIAIGDETAHLLDRLAGRHRARIAASEGNDAEGAAMIAAILDLHESAGALG